MCGVQPRFRVWWQLSEPGIPGLGVQKCSWQGFRKQKVRWGVRSVTELGGKGPLCFCCLVTCPVGTDRSRGGRAGPVAQCGHSCEIARTGRAGARGAASKAAARSLQRRQWRRGPQCPERRALTPEPAPFFRVRSLWETQDPPRPPLFPSPWAGAGLCPRPLQGRRLCGRDC